MGDYIDREALKEKFWNACKNCLSEDDIADLIDDIPAADVAPVVHGRWEWHGPCRDGNGKFWATCSACKVRQRLGDYERFCPNCGAKMDKEE